jgi:hypothetical protein
MKSAILAVTAALTMLIAGCAVQPAAGPGRHGSTNGYHDTNVPGLEGGGG